MIHKQRVLDSFLEYVQIDSETGNEKAMAERMTEELRALGGGRFHRTARGKPSVPTASTSTQGLREPCPARFFSMRPIWTPSSPAAGSSR